MKIFKKINEVDLMKDRRLAQLIELKCFNLAGAVGWRKVDTRYNKWGMLVIRFWR